MLFYWLGIVCICYQALDVVCFYNHLLFGWCSTPSLQGLLSNRVQANEQGELQGMMTALTSLSTILSPLIMTQLFTLLQSPMLLSILQAHLLQQRQYL
jgi:DHA1 family tetracycline resistance protein-like MFS transporter